MRIFSATTAILLLATGGSANAAKLSATSATFQSVMAKAVGGDTVTLTGNLGRTSLTNKDFSSLVTIDASAASFTDTFVINNVSNVNFIGGSYGSATSSTAWGRAVVVYGGTNVSFTNPNVVGYYGDQGLFFSGTSNVVVSGATLSKLSAGIIFGGVVGGSITNSKSIGSTGDGFDISDSSHIDIGHNSCTGGTPTNGAHPDCVQLFSSQGAQPLSYINIHDNYASGTTQGFDTFGAVAGSSHISIVNNRVDGLMPQGIVCGGCVNSTITGNILTSLKGAEFPVKLEVTGTNNIVSGNTIGTWDKVTAKPTVFYDRAKLIAGLNQSRASLLPSATAAVPEPAAWTMLIMGFGLVGCSQRSRHRTFAA